MSNENIENSVSYFYNNYCRREGIPEYSEEVFKEYQKQAELARQGYKFGRRRNIESYWRAFNDKIQFPFTTRESFKDKI